MPPLVMTDNQAVTLNLAPQGGSGQIDGVPVWTVSDATLGTLNVAPDGMSAVFSAKGVTGACQIIVTVDADLGRGVVSVTEVMDVTIGPAQVTGLIIRPGRRTIIVSHRQGGPGQGA